MSLILHVSQLQTQQQIRSHVQHWI